MATKDIITIGGSAGSTQVLRSIVADLPADLPASVFVATHVASGSPGYLAELLNAAGPLPAAPAVDDQPIERGRIYVAAPDRHLLVVDGHVRLGAGPRENMARPAIDPLFRSAALAHGPRVIGVVLSGMLHDGAAGLSAIKSCGGTAVVQHPIDAEAEAMPLAALETVAVDHVAPARDIGRLLGELSREEAGECEDPSPSLALEVQIAAGARLGSDALLKIAEPSPLSCPDCHGVLSEVRNQQPLRFRCQIGHAYDARALAVEHEEIDEAIKVAMRVMEERVTLVSRMAQDARDTGRAAVAELYEGRAAEFAGYAKTLREAATRTLVADLRRSASG